MVLVCLSHQATTKSSFPLAFLELALYKRTYDTEQISCSFFYNPSSLSTLRAVDDIALCAAAFTERKTKPRAKFASEWFLAVFVQYGKLISQYNEGTFDTTMMTEVSFNRCHARKTGCDNHLSRQYVIRNADSCDSTQLVKE